MEVPITIADLLQDWQEAHFEPTLEMWANLTDPNTRRLFRACRAAVASDGEDEHSVSIEAFKTRLLSKEAVPRQLDPRWNASAEHQRRTCLLHLELAELLMREQHWPSSTFPPDGVFSVYRIAESLDLPRGQALDILLELLKQPARPAVSSCSAALVLVPARGTTGEVMNLTVRRLLSGTQSLYACPALALVPVDQMFEQGLRAARTYVTSLGIWPKDVDVVWDLVLADTGKRPLALEGDSTSAGFALAIAKALVTEENRARN